ncbi:SDR family NAD(P)-dependent oxidoreductase [Aciduricibacillus chroicocephali]|uniref:SDR family NAD(P)-dependent oxidoreductase n=1 Tax=Aciduricibacillus chroicocephali TaxID=3054939 RepID=A0ABY9KX89_9BACI|nr:SDR family NAD(P)-dependent oxidoreductase [Bacillaceae bacterium 44XB]
MNYAIVTGTSRGLGEACAKLLIESGMHVFGIARNKNAKLDHFAKENHVQFNHIECDLGEPSLLEKRMEEILATLAHVEEVTCVYLINNAATLEPIDRADELTDAMAITLHTQVNLASPMLILNAVLHASKNNDWPVIAVNVTSGAGRRPIPGFSAYCSTKAGIDMYTETVAKELEISGSENKVLGFSPGIMDTDMQEEIRNSNEAAFHEVETFRAYKRNGHLRQVEEVSGILVDILTDPANAVSGKIYNVQDYF